MVSTEAKEMLPPQDIPSFRDANEVGKNFCWQCQPSGEIARGVQDPLMCRIVPPGVKSLSLNSAVSRRSTSAENGGADPDDEDDDEDDDVDDGAKPNIVVGRADPNAVDADNFQKYCIEGIVAVLGSMLLGMVLCCVLHVWRKRRK